MLFPLTVFPPGSSGGSIVDPSDGSETPIINSPADQEKAISEGLSFSSSSSSSSPSSSDYMAYSLLNYLSTLTSTVGMENKLNRDYNSAEAQLSRDFNAKEAELTRLFNASEAQKNRDWQEKMSNSAYQRAVADMKSAGINPILMASSGFSASSPSGSSASSSPTSGANASYNYGGGDTLSSLINSLANSARGLGSILEAFSPLLKTVGKIGFIN